MNKYKYLVIFLLILFSFTSRARDGRSVDSLKHLYKITTIDSTKVNLLLSISKKTSDSDTAGKLNDVRIALQIATRIKWSKGIINSYIELGRTYNNVSDQKKAIIYFLNAIDAAHAANDPAREGTAFEYLAASYFDIAQYNKSLDAYTKALQMTRDPDHVIGILGNIGTIYNTIGDYSMALVCYDSSLKILNDEIRTSKKSDLLDTMQMAGLFTTIGDVYNTMKQHDQALKNYTLALDLINQTKSKANIYVALAGIGKIYEYKKQLQKAVDYYRRAIEACNNTDHHYLITVLYQLGNVYNEMHNIDSSSVYSQRALRLGEEKGDSTLLPAIYTLSGKISLAKSRYADAEHFLLRAISMSQKNGALAGQEEAWNTLSTVYEKMNAPAKALDAYKHSISISDSLYNIEKENELTRIDLQSKYNTQFLADSLRQAGGYELMMQKQLVLTYGGYAGLAFVLLLAFFIYRNYAHARKANIAISLANETVKKEKQVSENLLLNILPENVARELKANGSVEAKLFDHVTVLFTDFVNFTGACERMTPQDLVAELHTCFKLFDEIIGRYNIEKIKTVGDAYLAVSGLPSPNPLHAVEVVKAAIEMRNVIAARRKQLGDQAFDMRIGIHSGTVIAGIVGDRKFAYDIWGDTVNTAARMQQYGEPGKVNISMATFELVNTRFSYMDRGEIEVKNKGKMRMFFVEA